jgi:hypothetical protein
MPVNEVTPTEIAARRTMARHGASVRAAMVAALLFTCAFTLATSSALAQAATPPPATPAGPAARAPSVQGYGDHDKTCTSWTDGCVSCQMGDKNAVACSNTGIACQPQAIACLVRRQEPAKEPDKQPAK